MESNEEDYTSVRSCEVSTKEIGDKIEATAKLDRTFYVSVYLKNSIFP
jgi:hypothetical protein